MSNGDRDIVNSVAEHGNTLQQIKTPYSTAVSVQVPRELDTVRRRLMDEASIGGEMMYYGWGAGKDHIEGPSIHLAMAAARCWGNCAVFPEPVQELPDSWIFTSSFVDLETGFTLQRQFRQSKSSQVFGKHHEERKSDIRFQVGQSKASRNVVVNALPKSIINEAMAKAKAGVRERLEKWIAAKGEGGLAMAQDGALDALEKLGIVEARVLAKVSRPTRAALTLDDLIVLKGDIVAIQDGTDRADELYPVEEAASGDGVMEHLANGDPEPEDDPPTPDPPKSDAKPRKRQSRKAKESEATTTPEPENDGKSSASDSGAEIEVDEAFVKDVCTGKEGPEVMEAVLEMKARFARLADDPLSLSKFTPNWEWIKAGGGAGAARVVRVVQSWYWAKARDAGFPQPADGE